jgi:flagellar motor switch protein FliM
MDLISPTSYRRKAANHEGLQRNPSLPVALRLLYPFAGDNPSMSKQDMDQSAIDSLFAGKDAVTNFTPVNFENRRSITPEQMHFLVSINHSFARSVGARLSSWLESDIRITMVAAERALYRDHLETCDLKGMYFGEAGFGSGAVALCCVDFGIADAVVHLSLGGRASIPALVRSREATAIDAAVIDGFLDTVWSDLNQLWASCGLYASYKCEIPASKIAKVFPGLEYLILFTYEIRIEGIEGIFQVALPAGVASILLREIDRRDPGRAPSTETRRLLCERLANSQHTAYLRLPKFRLNVGQLMQLEPGAIVPCGLPESTHAQFSIRGRKVWDAPLARRGEFLVAQIQELPPTGFAAASPALES